MTERVPVSRGQWILGSVWLLGFLAIAGLLVSQVVGGRLNTEAKIEEVWNWYLPLILPTMSLIIGVIAVHAAKPEPTATVTRSAYRLALILSLAYLVLLAVAPIINGTNNVDMLGMSLLWLTPIQTLVGVALGAFFQSRESGEASTT